MMKTEALTCPQCGAPIEASAPRCNYCGVNIYFDDLVSTSKLQKEMIDKILEFYDRFPAPLSERALLSKGIGYLRLGIYDLARTNFVEVMELNPDCAEAYFYQAVALLGGQRPRSNHLKNIRTIEGLLSAALQLQPHKGKYYFLLAAVKLDFYQANGLRESQPGANAVMALYVKCDKDAKEIDEILNMVGLTRRLIYSQLENQPKA
jgi:tetratricopeptide (TPR) repeat protein